MVSQFLITCKLAIFVKPTNPDLALSLVIADGYCQGFAMCYSAMDTIGKLLWWKAALNAVANWDMKVESLEKEVNLPQQEGRKKLHDIFVTVLNFIISSHSVHNKQTDNYLSVGQTQTTILEKKGEFELLDSDNIIKKIEDEQSIVGTYTEDQISNLLDEHMMSGKMTFVSRSNHIISIFYHPPLWGVYNPNYEHSSIETMQRYFITKVELINEIIRIQGNSIQIKICSLDPKKKVSFPISSSPPPSLPPAITIGNLYLLSKSSHFNKLIDDVINESTPEEILNLLISKDSRGILGISIIITNHAYLFVKMLNKIEQSERCLNKLSRALTLQEDDNNSNDVIHLLLSLTSNVEESNLTDRIWKSVDKYISNYPAWPEVNSKEINEINYSACLLQQQYINKDGMIYLQASTIVQHLAVQCPNTLPLFLNCIAKSKDGAEYLARAISLKNNIDLNDFHIIVQFTPNALPQYLKILANAENGIQTINNALGMKLEGYSPWNGWSGLTMIGIYAPASYPVALKYKWQGLSNTTKNIILGVSAITALGIFACKIKKNPSVWSSFPIAAPKL